MCKQCNILIKSYNGIEGCDHQNNKRGAIVLGTDSDVKITGVDSFNLLTSRGEMYTEAEGDVYVISYNNGRLRIRSSNNRVIFTRKTEALRLLINN